MLSNLRRLDRKFCFHISYLLVENMHFILIRFIYLYTCQDHLCSLLCSYTEGFSISSKAQKFSYDFRSYSESC